MFARRFPTLLLLGAAILPLVWMAWPQTPGSSAESMGGPTEQEHAPAPARGTQPLPPGVCSLSTIRIGLGAVIDDVDSGLEPFLGGLIQGSGQAQVWALDSIQVDAQPASNPTVIVGHARPGWAGGAMLAKGSFVTGSIEPKRPRLQWPRLGPWPEQKSRDESWDTGTKTWTAETKHVRELMLLGSAELRLQGPLELWVDRWICEDQSQVILDTQKGAIVIRIREGWAMGTETRWDSSRAQTQKVALLVGAGSPEVAEHVNDPKTAAERRARELRERLMGSGTAVKNVPILLEGRGQLRGLLYAPFTQFTLPPTLPMQGALTARSITLLEGARITTDSLALEAWPKGAASHTQGSR